ncbi:MAG TPA: hypothetical protein VMN56_01375 [Casimicrobiaceae bacterium]|nr:hypothetical protein [Casimicrobiaceae bacterium]
MRALRQRYGHATASAPMSAAEFVEALRSHLKIGDRYISIRNEPSWGPRKEDQVYVNFVNLPSDVVATKQGGGAEAENNRASYWIRGFGPAGAPAAKVKVEESNSVFAHRGGLDAYGAPRPAGIRMRAKTAAPAAVAKHLADHINKIVAEVPPNFTHTKGR